MAHYTLIARINGGDGKFPFVNAQFSKNHRPIPIEGATYYLRPGNRGRRTPIRIGRDLNAAVAALLNLENDKAPINVSVFPAVRATAVPTAVHRETVAEAAQKYIERSKQKSRKTFIGYRTAVDLLSKPKPSTYRIIDALDKRNYVVTVLHIRHAARAPLSAKEKQL